jgi:tetrahydromethanopterin S-methyltransferase subunit A
MIVGQQCILGDKQPAPDCTRTDQSAQNPTLGIVKVSPTPDYPPEEGRYLRGNDASPVAVGIILNCEPEKMPLALESLVRAGVEAGAALSGTVQTENIGFEKIICNITANPNIRYYP